MELFDVMRTTSAVRQFTDDPLPDDVLHTILDNARFAPSGGNRQGTQIVVVRDRGTRAALAELTLTGARRYVAQRRAGENPWNSVEPSRVTEEEVAATEVPADFTAPLSQCAVVLVVCVDLRCRRRARQGAGPDRDRRGGLGVPAGLEHPAGRRNEGFGGTITTMAVAEEPRVRELLGIPGHYAVACVLPLGKPVRQLRKLSRVEVGELTRREHWQGPPLTSSLDRSDP